MSEAARSRDTLVEGEFAFTRADFTAIARILLDETGISLADAKATLVYSRLGKRVRRLGMSSFKEYRSFIDSPDGFSERRAMMSALTTNVTRFFREPHHFEHLNERVFPYLAMAARGGQRVRIWSSACSSGEEAYSIGLTLLAHLPDAAKYDVRILATDIDPVILETARKGVYGETALAPVPRTQRDRWFQRDSNREDGWGAGSELRSLILFKELNLIGPWPLKGAFDVIFCRNVAIYFDEDTQKRLWERLRGRLVEGGRLYIGHSERIDLPGLENDGLTVYRQTGPILQ